LNVRLGIVVFIILIIFLARFLHVGF